MITTSLYFYDLETTGISPKRDRIMQFAGQRVSLNFEPIGEPDNILVRLSDDCLPSPEAVMVHGISVDDCLSKGVSEAELAEIINDKIAIPGTAIIGFNNIRFDDEFIRYLNFRNFYDPYGWQYKDGNSKWDCLDMIRMTRALRPEGIKWAVDEEGKPTNRLEKMTAANGIDHVNAHDALSDVMATISICKLIQDAQPDLFSYLFRLRNKHEVKKVLSRREPLVYTSSRYPSEVMHTAAVGVINFDPVKQTAVVFDLSKSPSEINGMTVDDIVQAWSYDPAKTKPALPFKTIKINHCPAIASSAVLTDENYRTLKVSRDLVERHFRELLEVKEELSAKLAKVAVKLDDEQQNRVASKHEPAAEEKLYDGFIDNNDARLFPVAREGQDNVPFKDKRLIEIYGLYKARNYRSSCNEDEEAYWRSHVRECLELGLPNGRFDSYVAKLKEIIEDANNKQYEPLMIALLKRSEAIANEYGKSLPAAAA